MTKWQHPDAHYFTVKRPNGKWSVMEKKPDGTKEYLGEYETQEQAIDAEIVMEKQGNALRNQASKSFEGRRKQQLKKEREKSDREVVETGDYMNTTHLHQERLSQRQEDIERARDNLTRHQIRRQGRH